MVSQALMSSAGAGYNHGYVLGLDHNVAINYGSHGGFRESRALNPVSCYEWCKHCTHSTKYIDFFVKSYLK